MKSSWLEEHNKMKSSWLHWYHQLSPEVRSCPYVNEISDFELVELNYDYFNVRNLIRDLVLEALYET